MNCPICRNKMIKASVLHPYYEFREFGHVYLCEICKKIVIVDVTQTTDRIQKISVYNTRYTKPVQRIMSYMLDYNPDEENFPEMVLYGCIDDCPEKVFLFCKSKEYDEWIECSVFLDLIQEGREMFFDTIRKAGQFLLTFKQAFKLEFNEIFVYANLYDQDIDVYFKYEKVNNEMDAMEWGETYLKHMMKPEKIARVISKYVNKA